MQWSWKLGRFAGIDTYVHASFLLLVAWAAWAAWSGAGTGAAVVLGVLFLLAVFASVLLHELGHALMARRYGIATRRIILSPIGGIAQLEGMPRKPRQELAVALAGPAVNFVLATGLWLVLPVFAAAPLLATLLTGVMTANLMLGLFNLVPAFPMDGGRALRALLAERIGSRRATETAAKVGKGVAIAMGLVGLLLWQNFLLVAVAAFVWFAANAELQASRYRSYGVPYGGSGAYYDDDPSHEQVEVLGAPRRRRPWWRGRSESSRLGYDDAGPYAPRGRGRFVRYVQADHDPRIPTPAPIRVVFVRRNWW